MEVIRRRYRRAEGDDAWIAPLATALQNFQLIYLVGALFVGIAYQPFVYLMIASPDRLRHLARAGASGPRASRFARATRSGTKGAKPLSRG